MWEKDRREKEENWRDFGAERQAGAESHARSEAQLDQLRERTEAEGAGVDVLSRAMRDQARELQRLAFERRQELRRIESAIKEADRAIRDLELMHGSGGPPAPAAVTPGPLPAFLP